ncbi:MAG: DUF4159 domain-containing protein [Endomicrobiia bacterium]
MKKIILLILFFNLLFSQLSAEKFKWVQLKYNGNWDPVPFVYIDVINILTLTTSISCENERVVIDVDSNSFEVELSRNPFIIILGDDELNFSKEKINILRNYVLNGGTIFIEDISELRYSKFDTSVRKILKEMFPEYKLKKTTSESVLLRSFYLLTKVSGRILLNEYLEFVEYENRPSIIYSRNNIISCWARDKFGKFMFNCVPDGETQRFNSQKLFLNIIMYSLCGTYKSDQVHQPYINQRLKLRKW